MISMTRIEARLARREPVTLVVSLAFPLMLLTVLLAVFGNQPEEGFGGVGGTDYYVPAYVAAVIVATGLIALPVHLASYKETGVLRRFEASGVESWVILGSQAAVMLGVVLLGAGLMVGVGFAAYDLSAPESLGAVALGLLVGTAAFASVGVLMAASLPGVRSAQAVGLLAFFGMFFIAGGGPPRSILPDWLGTVGDLLPMTYAVRAVQNPWIGAGWDWIAIGVLLAMGAISALTASALWSRQAAS